MYLTDKNGISLAMSGAEAGNHHNTFEIDAHFSEVIAVSKDSEINMDGLFLNADPGFDCQQFRALCFRYGTTASFAGNKRSKAIDDDIYFGQQLYKERYSVERTNTWPDGFRSLFKRHDSTVSSWKVLHYIALIIIGLKKSKNLNEFGIKLQ